MKAGAILLAGGQSSRMGTDKALLPIKEKTNIDRLKDELSVIFDEVILVCNQPEDYRFLNIMTVSDSYPGKGPLAGIHAGLQASSYEENIVIACDMPFITGELARGLVECLKHYEAVVPVVEGRQHPLCAAYLKSVFEKAADCIEEGQLRVRQLLERLEVQYLGDSDLKALGASSLDKTFFNMNRPEDYELVKKWTESIE